MILAKYVGNKNKNIKMGWESCSRGTEDRHM